MHIPRNARTPVFVQCNTARSIGSPASLGQCCAVWWNDILKIIDRFMEGEAYEELRCQAGAFPNVENAAQVRIVVREV